MKGGWIGRLVQHETKGCQGGGRCKHPNCPPLPPVDDPYRQPDAECGEGDGQQWQENCHCQSARYASNSVSNAVGLSIGSRPFKHMITDIDPIKRHCQINAKSPTHAKFGNLGHTYGRKPLRFWNRLGEPVLRAGTHHARHGIQAEQNNDDDVWKSLN